MANLPSQALGIDELARIGSQYSARRVVDGGRRLLQYAKEDGSVLAELGFDDAWSIAMSQGIDALSQQLAQRENAPGGARTTGQSEGSSADAVVSWVNRVNGAIAAAVPHPTDVPHLAPHWQAATQLESAAKAVAAWVAKQTALAVPGGPAAFAAQGQSAIAAFVAARGAHRSAIDAVSPEVKQLHAAEVLMVSELLRLAGSARHVVAHDRVHLYSVGALKAAAHAGAGGPPPPSVPPTAPGAPK